MVKPPDITHPPITYPKSIFPPSHNHLPPCLMLIVYKESPPSPHSQVKKEAGKDRKTKTKWLSQNASQTPKKQPTRLCHSPPNYTHQLCQHAWSGSPYGPDKKMEEDTDWTKEEHHFIRLSRVRELLSELHEEFSAAQNEHFLTDDPEIRENIVNFSTILPPENINYLLNSIYAGITDIHKLSK